jgi:hypothetical protein
MNSKAYVRVSGSSVAQPEVRNALFSIDFSVIRYSPSNQVVGGSNPSGRTKIIDQRVGISTSSKEYQKSSIWKIARCSPNCLKSQEKQEFSVRLRISIEEFPVLRDEAIRMPGVFAGLGRAVLLFIPRSE